MKTRLFFPLLLCGLTLWMGCQSSADTPPTAAPVILQNPTWAVQPTDTNQRLQAISAVDANVVWASGTGGTYARTTDGGQTWTTAVVPGTDTLQFRDIHAVDANTAYLLSAGTGTASRIYKTTDAGANWTLQFTNQVPTGFMDCFDFWDPSRGVAFGDAVDGRVMLIRTENGGQTWTSVPPENIPEALPNEGGFAASGTCLVVQSGGFGWVGSGASGVKARIYRTTDYGATWAVHDTPIVSDSPTSGIFSLVFADPQTGYALGGDFTKTSENSQNVAHTTDGGLTWTLVGGTQITGSVFGAAYVYGTATPTLIAVAPTGSDFSTDGGATWTRIDTVDYWATTFVDAQAGWAVGPQGRIAKLVNGTE